MLHTVGRIINGFRMLWATLLVCLRYPILIFASLVIGLVGQNAAPYLSGATMIGISSPKMYGMALFAILASMLFIMIAAMKYLTASLDNTEQSTRHKSAYHLFGRNPVEVAEHIVSILLWSFVITIVSMAVTLTAGPIHIAALVVGALVAAACFFVPALIAEGKLSFYQLIPESTRLFIKYWPEIIGFLTLGKALLALFGLGILLISSGAEAIPTNHLPTLLPVIMLTTFLRPIVMKVILVRADRGQHVGEDFAPDLPGSKA